jgi:hypothetical protein
MKRSRILGISLIILSWVFWGMIIIVPFLKLGIKTKAVALTILFIASNIFWVGAILIGKELAQKYQVWPKIKRWLNLKP